MATTTFGTTSPTTRKNTGLYWAIGLALLVIVIAFLTMSNRTPQTVPRADVPSTQGTLVAPSGTSAAPETNTNMNMNDRMNNTDTLNNNSTTNPPTTNPDTPTDMNRNPNTDTATPVR